MASLALALYSGFLGSFVISLYRDALVIRKTENKAWDATAISLQFDFGLHRAVHPHQRWRQKS